jgi:hypothetical protein
MPTFTGTDVYQLDGMPVVACAAGVTSPSCSTGGTHATESESYRRISFSGNIWTVTDRDRTVSRFSSVATIAGISPAAGTPSYQLAYSYRWLLTSVTDANGNAVTYTYFCPGSAANPINPTCYPNTISYNGTIITLYREARPDKLLMGNGLDISETAYRIKSIVTKVGGVLRDAYLLQYDQAPFSNASRLTKVTRFGSDATVATDGTPSGGTSKPVAQMDYQDTDGVYTTQNVSIYGVSPPRSTRPSRKRWEIWISTARTRSSAITSPKPQASFRMKRPRRSPRPSRSSSLI